MYILITKKAGQKVASRLSDALLSLKDDASPEAGAVKEKLSMRRRAIMTMKQIKDIAKEKGVKAGAMKKTDLVRAIQRAEGNADCFGAGRESCDQFNCLWRVDCLTIK